MRVAFVVQRCGREVNGGAEAHCLQVAQRMAKHWQTEVLTTCALDYMTWDNYYPDGYEEVGPALIRRFRTDRPRDVAAFDRLSAELHARQAFASLSEQEEWMLAQGPVSTALLRFIEENKAHYDAFVFFTYLYATTYFSLPLVRDKAYLAPLAHDEWTIYFTMWNRFFSLPRALVFNTDAERAFLRQRFPGLRLEGEVVGVGIEAPDDIHKKAFVDRYGLDEPFLLYVGRIDEAKGCDQMLDWFVRYRARAETAMKLVLIGRDVMPVPFHDDIIHLGFVSDDERWAAMASCEWLLLPSVNESLSMVLLEVWAAGRPAIVNGRCPVLVEHCRRSHCGIWYDDEKQLEAALRNIDDPIKDKLGQQGRSYVAANYNWEKVEAAYLKLVDPSVDFQLECAVSGR